MQQIKRVLGWTVASLTMIACSCWLAYLGSRPVESLGTAASRWPSTLALLVLVAFVPSCASSLALWFPKRAVLLLVFCVVFLGIWLAALRIGHAGFPAELLEISVQSARVKMSYVVFTFLLLVLPGLFWFATVRRNWLPVGPTAIIGQYRIAAIAIVIAGVVVSIAAILMDLHIHDWAECHFLVPPFSRQQSPEQVVFNGRVIKTGLIWPSRLSVEQQPTILRKYWAVTIVDKHFWGLPWWDHEIVIVTLLQRSPGDFLRPGETYFIDARHRPGSLTRVLPVFETSCSRTARLEDAELDLRVLRDGNPQNGVRIIGRTVRGTFDHRSEPLPRTRVLINGPAGQIIATSDQDGIYDVSGLPPGEYAIGAQANDEQVALQHPDCIFRGWDQPAKSGDIRECLVSVK